MSFKSYWSYGKVNHKDGAMIPEGRVLIDTAKSFIYTDIQASGPSPNLTFRSTSGWF